MLKKYSWRIAKWTLIGLVIRAALMPFTMHGQDLIFINYFPMMSITKGIWDIYDFTKGSFPYSPHTYYGPVLYFIIAIANFIFIRIFNFTSLVAMLNLGGNMICKTFTTGDYVKAFYGLGLFQNLFLMKSPYLIFDFLVAAILLKLAPSKSSVPPREAL